MQYFESWDNVSPPSPHFTQTHTHTHMPHHPLHGLISGGNIQLHFAPLNDKNDMLRYYSRKSCAQRANFTLTAVCFQLPLTQMLKVICMRVFLKQLACKHAAVSLFARVQKHNEISSPPPTAQRLLAHLITLLIMLQTAMKAEPHFFNW